MPRSTLDACELTTSAAIRTARLWDPEVWSDLGELPTAGQMWADHVTANRAPGVKASAIRTAARGKLVQAGAEADYERNLY